MIPKGGILTAGFFAILCALTSVTAAGHDLLKLLGEAHGNYEKVSAYTAVFYKQQRVSGTLHEEEEILIKFRRPFMIYMKWIGNVDRGRELIYAEGRHRGKLLVHMGGFVNLFSPSFSLHPDSALAMRKNLRPVTESGMGNTIGLLKEVCEVAAKNGDLEVNYLGEGEVGGRPTYRFERLLPDGKGYPARRTVIELDKETKFPLFVDSHGWNGELLERYMYTEFKTDVDLSDEDFDWRNRNYSFGRLVVPL